MIRYIIVIDVESYFYTGSGVGHTIEVKLRQAWLVLGLVTTFGNGLSVADLEGAESAPAPLWAMDWRRHSRSY